eukprot:1793378-Rhodomonas_salina.1
MNNPSAKLIKAAKQVLQYLKGTQTMGITFYQHDPLSGGKKLYSYCDASYADDSFKRRSTGGYVCYYNGSPVSWSTGLQRLTTLSTCESEELLHYAGHTQTTVTQVFEDNEAAMKLSENPINRGMSKHISRHFCHNFHFLHQCGEDRHVALGQSRTASLHHDAAARVVSKGKRHACVADNNVGAWQAVMARQSVQKVPPHLRQGLRHIPREGVGDALVGCES